jgi:hypothetical protein
VCVTRLTDAPRSGQRVRLMSLTPRTAGKLMLYLWIRKKNLLRVS